MSCTLPFQHPTTILIAGPTLSGKTTFVKRVISNEMIQPPPERIIWFYKEKDDEVEMDSMRREFPYVQFHSDLEPSICDKID